MMQLRRDEWGRPVGLDWPPAPPVEPAVVKKHAPKKVYPRKSRAKPGARKGAPRQEFCKSGRHRMDEYGTLVSKAHPEKGRYCRACQAEKKREKRKQAKS